MPNNRTAATTRPGPRPADLRQSALAAYNQGLPTGPWEAPAPIISGCISVASILQSATRSSSAAERAAMVQRAADIAAGFLSPAERATGGCYDPIGHQSPAVMIRAFLEKMDHPGIRHQQLADHILESLAALYPLSSIDAGMILNARSITAGKLGAQELRLERGRELLRAARMLGDDVLLFNAWGSLAGYFETRGNLPKTERASRRAMKYAERSGDARLIAQGHIGLGVVSGLRGDFDNSLRHLWRAYRTADHPRLRTGALANLAETLYRTGHYQASRAARAVVLHSESNVYGLFITLGGYAVCCSALGDVQGVLWAANQLLALAEKHPANRATAQGLLGGADACGEIGLNALARGMYDRGMAIAEAQGYHDLRFRPDPTRRVIERVEVRRLDGEAGDVRDSIVRMAPHGVASDYTPVPA